MSLIISHMRNLQWQSDITTSGLSNVKSTTCYVHTIIIYQLIIDTIIADTLADFCVINVLCTPKGYSNIPIAPFSFLLDTGNRAGKFLIKFLRCN